MTSKFLIISLHDLHPGSLRAISEQVDFCHALGISRFSILIIPHYHHGSKTVDDATTLAWLDQRAGHGDDLILHGYYHDRQDRQSGSWFYTKFYTANESEFLDLSNEEVVRRISEGSQLWRKKNWALNGFIAPAWLMPQEQDKILEQLGFTYTTHLKSIHLLKKQQSVMTQSLCYSTRAPWRVQASLLWNQHLFRRLIQSQTNVIRLSLHPNDLSFPAIRTQIARFLELTLAKGFKPVSYSEYAAL